MRGGESTIRHRGGLSQKAERDDTEQMRRRQREQEDEERRNTWEREQRVQEAVLKMQEHRRRLEEKRTSAEGTHREDRNVLYLLNEHIHESRIVAEQPGCWAKVGYSREVLMLVPGNSRRDHFSIPSSRSTGSHPICTTRTRPR